MLLASIRQRKDRDQDGQSRRGQNEGALKNLSIQDECFKVLFLKVKIYAKKSIMDKISKFQIKTGSIIMLTRALLELEAEGKIRNTDPVFIKGILIN